jgi:hypothetical protein
LAFSALFFGCAIAYAQTSAAPPADPSAMSATSTQQDANGTLSTPRSTGQDKTTDNDMVSRNNKPPEDISLSAPRSTGEDKTTGNDMVSRKRDTQPGAGKRPDFNTLDTKKNGYLTAGEVKSHKWLSKNFSSCDSDHDGHLSQEEYANCTK